MTTVIKNGDNTQSAVVEIVADYREDINSLSTKFAPGSSCLVLEDSSVWCLNHEETWCEL